METTKETAQEIAGKLLDVRKDMADLRRVEKKLSTDLRKRMNDGEDQDHFRFVPAIKFEIEDIALALKWAKKHAPHLLTVDTSAARVIFAQDAQFGKMGAPEKHGFTIKTTETLREMRVGEAETDFID
jgi:hypothetical protein